MAMSPRKSCLKNGGSPKNNVTPKNNGTLPSKPDWAARQISAAYDEHSAIIESLRSELDHAKKREKALVEEFKEKVEMFQASEYLAQRSTSSVDEEMPMDEMQDVARVERMVLGQARVDQQRYMEQFRVQQEKEMNALRDNSQRRILKIEESLQAKVEEIERLRNNAKRHEAERKYFYSMHNGGMNSAAASTSSRDGSNVISQVHHVEIDDDANHVTPTMIRTDVIQTVGSYMDSTIGSDSSRNSPLYSKKDMNTVETGNNSKLERLDKALDLVVQQSRGKKTEEDDSQLSEDEIKFINRIKLMLQSSQRRQRSTILALKKELEEKSNELVEEVGATLQLEEEVNSRKQQVEELENELEKVKASKKNFSELEENLQMLQKARDTLAEEKATIEDQLKKSEIEKKELIEKNNSSQEDTKGSMLAIQRVMADVAASKDKEIERLQIRLEVMTKENIDLQKSLDPSFDAGKTSISSTCLLIEEEELNALREQAEKKAKLDIDLNKSMAECEDITEKFRQSEDVVKTLKKMVGTLEDQISTLESFEKVKDLEDQISNILKEKHDVETKVSELEMSLLKINEERANSDDENKRVKAQVLELQKQKELLEVKKSEDLMNIEDLKQNLLNVNSKSDSEIEGLKKQREELEHENNSLKTKSAQMEKDLSDLKNGMDSISNNAKETKERLNKLRSINKEYKETIESNENMLAIIKKDKRACDIITYEKRIRALTKDKKSLQATIDDIMDKGEHVDALQEEVEMLRLQVSQAKEILETAKGSHARELDLEEQLSEIENSLDEALQSKSLLEKELKQKETLLKSKESSDKESLHKLEEKNTLLIDEIKQLKGELNNLRENGLKNEEIILLVAASKDVKIKLEEQKMLHSDLQKNINKDNKVAIDKLKDLLLNIQDSLTKLDIFESLGNVESIMKSYQKGGSGLDIVGKIRRLEESLSMKTRENEKVKSKLREIETKNEEDAVLLKSEISQLKIQCTRNSETLAKKNEELRVLQESLKEPSLGYISGDDSDSETDGSVSSNNIGSDFSSSDSKDKNSSVPHNVDVNSLNHDINKILREKKEAEKQAKANAESLANAKMIISSLEESNKTMTADLRARLHDSNQAIFALLEQGKLHEKNLAESKQEIERLKKERELEENILKSEIIGEI